MIVWKSTQHPFGQQYGRALRPVPKLMDYEGPLEWTLDRKVGKSPELAVGYTGPMIQELIDTGHLAEHVQVEPRPQHWTQLRVRHVWPVVVVTAIGLALLALASAAA